MTPELTVQIYDDYMSFALACKLFFDPLFKEAYAPKKLITVMVDSKDATTATWQRLRIAQKLLSKLGAQTFILTKEMEFKSEWEFLENYICGKYDIQGGRKKGFYEFRERFGKICVLDCPQSEDKDPKWMRECITKRYPFDEIRMSLDSCQEYVRNKMGSSYL